MVRLAAERLSPLKPTQNLKPSHHTKSSSLYIGGAVPPQNKAAAVLAGGRARFRASRTPGPGHDWNFHSLRERRHWDAELPNTPRTQARAAPVKGDPRRERDGCTVSVQTLVWEWRQHWVVQSPQCAFNWSMHLVILRFTCRHAFCCGLHRPTSRAIHH